MAGETDLAVLLRTMQPALDAAQYVYALVDQLPAGLLPFAVICEDEGITVVLTRDQADRHGLGYAFVSRRIMLGVHSSLEAVGLTAAVSTALAGRGISCNVIAGVHHDHLFVPNDRAEEALEALRKLSEPPTAQVPRAGVLSAAWPRPQRKHHRRSRTGQEQQCGRCGCAARPSRTAQR